MASSQVARGTSAEKPNCESDTDDGGEQRHSCCQQRAKGNRQNDERNDHTYELGGGLGIPL